ncbi:MAG: class I SAM-dependent methyltransferase [Thermoanaerobaculia bacterium]
METDLFLAHRSIYAFIAQWVPGKRVLDAGSGAGYGTALLAASGAASAVGIDSDSRFVRYARRRYGRSRVEFRVEDCSALELAAREFDIVACSNVLEHLASPVAFLDSRKRGLKESGSLFAAVPWIADEFSLDWNRRNPWHLSNLRVDEWAELFEREGWRYRLWSQTFDPSLGVPDFLDPRPSHRPLSEFHFREQSVSEALATWSLGVTFQLNRVGSEIPAR